MRVSDIPSALDLAIRNNKQLPAAAKQVALRGGAVAERRAALNPTLGTTLSAVRFDQGASASLGGQTIPLQKETQREVGVAAALPLDLSGQVRAAVGQAKLEELESRLDYNALRNDLLARVKADCYAVLRTDALVRVAEDTLKNAQERLRIAEINLQAGASAEFDVVRARTDVASAREMLLRARNDVELSRAQLRRRLGVGPEAEIGIAEPEEGDVVVDGDLTRQAEANRPESLRSQLAIRAAEQGVKLARRSSEPDVALTYGFSYRPDAAGFSPKTDAWQAGVSLRIPLFDGGVSAARTRQARSLVEIARSQQADVGEQIALEVQQASLAVLNAQERIPVATAALTEAKESYRLAMVRFKAGVTLVPGTSPLLEVNDAQTALTRAETNLVHARYDLLSSVAGLDRALGRYAYGEEPGVAGPEAIRQR